MSNQPIGRYRSWTVERALSWQDLHWLAAADDSGAFFWTSRDSHILDCFPIIRSGEEVLPR